MILPITEDAKRISPAELVGAILNFKIRKNLNVISPRRQFYLDGYCEKETTESVGIMSLQFQATLKLKILLMFKSVFTYQNSLSKDERTHV